ncbi:2-oxoglutarate dehydrogenase E1 component [Croceimicrobium hydrocarbonivorans]|uniref:oxoglutarate dehydrogenase (succinyl-transferring) n=1 Tax=Croceimicrobium hydrocarbonivorans TaxID=2761580 RepID=A0A7H0VID2_9FLAO|nr:2-oxoglutarate dehydrogenase E1 component [Croceimicrobium hydrocarbonivorans]QNR25480.1 2-oxoglutarate dehydrogenase E1 component [Croceimicrobium hydrocarbonivorans]
MDRFSFLGGVHSTFIDDLYQRYLKSPDNIEPSWRAFFQGYDFAREEYGDEAAAGIAYNHDEIVAEIRKEFQVLALIDGYRTRGHLFTATNPVRSRREYEPKLNIENFGLQQSDLNLPFQAAKEIGFKESKTLAEIIQRLEEVYCRSIGIEYMYLGDPERIRWIQSQLHVNNNHPDYTADEKKLIVRKLNEAVAFENFINRKFVGQKRFSIEGAESLIPALEFGIRRAANLGVEEFVMGMAHRGRLNVLSNIFGKTQRDIFSEFEGKEFEDEEFDGDVKYHLGYTTTKELDSGKIIKLNLSPNPSHLEAVDAVVTGIARAKINTAHGKEKDKVMPILIHGDAAVAAQGIVYEVLQMETLDGYHTGGTVHIVINNQVGFTTNYLDARSSIYCTDIAKTVQAPVLHVNGDDVEAVIHATLFAMEYRQRYNRDIFIDLLCYRKYGHNEGDEPRFTQPLLYKEISKHPNPMEIYSKKLEDNGVIDKAFLKSLENDFKEVLEMRFDESKKIEKNTITQFMADEWDGFRTAEPKDFSQSLDSSFDIDKLKSIARTITTLPEGKKFFVKIKKLMEDRWKMVDERNSLDWGMAELLAYGSLIVDGYNVRISGEDTERGTFSHRHAVIKVEDSEEEHILLNNIPGREGRFAIYNSLLSEYGVMGFDYGYAMSSPETLVVWEAQFGDFFNGAQIIVDQFLSAAEDKWKVQNGLVLYLPHGYEGQGAEHSSARLERWLQQCAQYNMQVVNITTPANFYHMIRRQMLRDFRKPLVVMTPKSLLRHPKVQSPLEDLATGRFRELLDDPRIEDRSKVKKLFFLSGKLYYDIDKVRDEKLVEDRAFIRLEQLYPLASEQINDLIASYPNADEIYWAQEEPMNMGASWYVQINFPVKVNKVFATPASASTAAGSSKLAALKHNNLIQEIFNT